MPAGGGSGAMRATWRLPERQATRLPAPLASSASRVAPSCAAVSPPSAAARSMQRNSSCGSSCASDSNSACTAQACGCWASSSRAAAPRLHSSHEQSAAAPRAAMACARWMRASSASAVCCCQSPASGTDAGGVAAGTCRPARSTSQWDAPSRCRTSCSAAARVVGKGAVSTTMPACARWAAHSLISASSSPSRYTRRGSSAAQGLASSCHSN